MNSIFEILLAVIVVGGALYIVKLLPIDETVKKIGTVVVIIVAAVWALRWIAGNIK